MMKPLPAGADSCKSPGQSCRTTKSCCTGVCVKGTTPFGKCCTPTTCQAAGANCGTIADGDCAGLTLDCGTCADPETCGGGGAPNVCGTSTTITTTTTTTSSTTTTTTMPISCSAGETDCGGSCCATACCSGVCTDTAFDPSNCGSCGHQCIPGESCVATSLGGVCSCGSPKTVCGLQVVGGGIECGPEFPPCTCSDLQTDPSNCGACGNVCPDGTDCLAGACLKQCCDDRDCGAQGYCCSDADSTFFGANTLRCTYAHHCVDRIADVTDLTFDSLPPQQGAGSCARDGHCAGDCCCYADLFQGTEDQGIYKFCTERLGGCTVGICTGD